MRARSALAGLFLALLVAAPAAANTTDRFTFDDVLVDEYSCGVVITTWVHAVGTAHLAADGTWLGTTIRFEYTGEASDPASGATIALTGRQIIKEAPGNATLIGQGIFIRVAGQGVVLLDVGRLVFDPSDGSTLFASAQVLPFEDPEVSARIDAAACSLFV